MSLPELAPEKKEREPITAVNQPIHERLSYGSPLHAEVLAELQARLNLAEGSMTARYGAWERVDEQICLHVNLAQKAIKGDQTLIDDKLEMPFQRSIVVPVSYAVLQVRLSQLMGILSQEPMFPIQGHGAEDISPSVLMQSAVDYDLRQDYNGFLASYMVVQNTEKYGMGIIYDTWEREMGFIPRPRTSGDALKNMIFAILKMRTPTEMRQRGLVREFNKWTAINPYRFYPDPRVPKTEIQRGEFVGHHVHQSYLWLLERNIENEGPYFNIEAIPGTAANQGDKGKNIYQEELFGSSPSMAGVTQTDKGYVSLVPVQVKLIPRDWKLGDGTLPEIWWFAIANNAVIVRAHKSPYEHGKFTYSVAEANYNNNSIFNPGNIENLNGLQRFMNWMFNSHVQNVQKGLNNALIYPPTFVEETDLANPGPAWHVRLTQEGEALVAQGMNPAALVHQLQMTDVTGPHLQVMEVILDMVQRMSATNDPISGQATKERKTLGEINRMLGGVSQRVGLTWRLYEALCFHALVQRSIQNRQQFTSLERYIRIVGDEMQQMGGDISKLVDQMSLQGNFDYAPRSHVLPPDPARQAMVWTQMVAGLSKFPQAFAPDPMTGRYLDIQKIFNEMARTMGIRHIGQFYSQMPMMPMMPGMAGPPQVVPDDQFNRQREAGNFIPAQMPGVPGMTP